MFENNIRKINKWQLMLWALVYETFDGTCNIPEKMLLLPLWDGSNEMDVATFVDVVKKYNLQLACSASPSDDFGVFHGYWKEFVYWADNNGVALLYNTNYMSLYIYNNMVKIYTNNCNNITLDSKNCEEILTAVHEERLANNELWQTGAYIDLIDTLKRALTPSVIDGYTIEPFGAIKVYDESRHNIRINMIRQYGLEIYAGECGHKLLQLPEPWLCHKSSLGQYAKDNIIAWCLTKGIENENY